ncbi:sensor histidine kinase [Paenibacillus spiritus]|uniref:histidine kinase n=1 Tax=Paenibacillus spiritus TaxID=2496557 RepID=A0A5J5GB56_9BACL|nr:MULTISPECIES: histidine kinase [Paenibacillus]KAA9005337.1 sensor histidine kinase [Paenibacillus spiritus]
MRSKWNLFGLVNDIPIKQKFLFIYLLCVLAPILSINTLFYRQIGHNAQVQEQENLQISVDRASYDLLQMVDECVAIGNTIAADRTFNELLDRDYADFSDYYDTYNDILRDKLRQYTNLHSYISWIGVYTSNTTISSGGSYFAIKPEDAGSGWYRKIAASRDKAILVSYLDANPMNPQQQMVYVSIIRKLDNYPDLFNHTQYLRIDLRLDNLMELFRKERSYLKLRLVDDDNRVVLESGRSYYAVNGLLTPLEEGTEESRHNGKEFSAPLGSASYLQGWRLIGVPESEQADQAQRSAWRLFILLALATIIVPSVLITIIFRSYNTRVSRLYKHMKLVKYERFEPIAMYEGKDEIGGLLRSFNLMTEKIKNLINDVYKLEIQKKDLELEQVRAELKLLQSQVDPHFLFNTLNAVLVVCKKYQYEQVTDIIRNLSQILRRLLNWKDDMVTISEEIELIEMYLQIEKFRFQDRFSYELNVDPGVLSGRIPKMSIQSLVENSCKHGLQSVKGLRRIAIGVYAQGEELRIAVRDNGIGLDAEKLEEIERHLRSDENSGRNIGLRNVSKRLDLYYQGRAELRIESRIHEGTTIRIRIPLELVITKEEENGDV